MNRKLLKLLVIAVVILCIAGGLFAIFSDDAAAPGSGNRSKSNGAGPEKDGTGEAFDKSRYSIDDPASLWVVVTKKRPLPPTYRPDVQSASGVQLRKESGSAVQELITGAAGQGVSLKAISGYRSYETQQSLYKSYLIQDGQAGADTYSARAGFSEHQTGLASDLGNSNGSCDLETCFANTPGGKWIAEHAHEYGFTISYPDGKTSITGYQYEPWHIRYVGKELAAELKNSGQTMQEFFGLPASPGY